MARYLAPVLEPDDADAIEHFVFTNVECTAEKVRWTRDCKRCRSIYPIHAFEKLCYGPSYSKECLECLYPGVSMTITNAETVIHQPLYLCRVTKKLHDGQVEYTKADMHRNLKQVWRNRCAFTGMAADVYTMWPFPLEGSRPKPMRPESAVPIKLSMLPILKKVHQTKRDIYWNYFVLEHHPTTEIVRTINAVLHGIKNKLYIPYLRPNRVTVTTMYNLHRMYPPMTHSTRYPNVCMVNVDEMSGPSTVDDHPPDSDDGSESAIVDHPSSQVDVNANGSFSTLYK